MKQIDKRLEALERQHQSTQRTLRRWRGAAITLAAVGLLMGHLRPGMAAGENEQGGLPALQATVIELKAQVQALEEKLARVTVTNDGKDLYLTGANLHIVNGSNSTNDTQNGLGNLIIGYNESRDGVEWIPSTQRSDQRTGSHNLILGIHNNYTSSQAILTGAANTSTSLGSIVSGVLNTASDWGNVVFGLNNTASGRYANVLGGRDNIASGEHATVSGGFAGLADGWNSTISGGQGNRASDAVSSVSGGAYGWAKIWGSSISGGQGNTAAGPASAIGGGAFGLTQGWGSSVHGGWANIAAGNSSTVGGGSSRTASADGSWRAGTLSSGP